MARSRGRRVYSTDAGRTPRGSRSAGSGPRRSLPPEHQTAGIRREKKGRGGKTVTVVVDLRLTPADLKALGQTLRKACGTGGTAKNGTIEVQGDHREQVAETLQGLGYKTKFVGG